MNIEDIRAVCLRFPHATEDVKWEHDLAFCIGGKMFCVVGLSNTPTTATFKVKDEDFDETCTRNGFMPAPYLARYKWVHVDDVNRMSKKEWEHVLQQSYQMVFDKLPMKIKKTLI